MGIIGFLESLVILIGFSLPICYVAEILGDSAGRALWERSARKTRGYTNTETLTL
jgi:hypothetical protein